MKINLRAYSSEDGKRYIEGYASVFNMQSRTIVENGRTFREIIRNNAFDEIIGSEGLNVVANVDHDMQRMLGRSTSGTLTLNIDTRGLKYTIEVPDTQLGRDTYTHIERGDFYESSFAYGARESDIEWGRDRGDGMLLRYVNKVSALRDVAIVRNGAFKNTDVSLRSDSLEYIKTLVKNTNSGDITLSKRSGSDILEIDEVPEETPEENIKDKDERSWELEAESRKRFIEINSLQ
tara:strand:+ start:6728 stop:7432 length:705 start_codon:yes stop_codon:yes gene_type:complete